MSTVHLKLHHSFNEPTNFFKSVLQISADSCVWVFLHSLLGISEQRSLSVQQWLETLQSDDEDFLNDSSDVPDHKGSSFPPDLRLAMGAVIAEEMRAQVYADTGFRCSAGIAHNKVP